MLLTCAHLRNSKNLMCGYKSNIFPLIAPPPTGFPQIPWANIEYYVVIIPLP